MENIIKSVRLYNQRVRAEFKESMAELLLHENFRRLANFRQHYKYTRLKHSVDVGYASFYVAKLLGLDYISAGKAALLHDLCFHEKTGLKSGLKHSIKMLRQHPKDALENALEICELSEKERDIIIRHMWLVTLRPPKYIEGFVVTFVDKYCASREFITSLFSRNQACKSGEIKDEIKEEIKGELYYG